MKKKHILLTIYCLIIINSGFVFLQIHPDIPEGQKRIIEQIKEKSATTPQLENTALDIDFADSLIIYTPEVDKILPEPDQLSYLVMISLPLL